MASSLRCFLLAPGFWLLASLALGCQPAVQTPEPQPLAPHPAAFDENIRQRDWERTSARYPNAAVIAGPTGFDYEPDPELEWAASLAVEPALFVGQTFFLPVNLILTPPWTEVEHRGTDFEPTHHAQPPLD